MKAFLAAVAVAVLMAVGVAAVLSTQLQRESNTTFRTEGVRL